VRGRRGRAEAGAAQPCLVADRRAGLVAGDGDTGADPVRLRFQRGAADRRARRISAGEADVPTDAKSFWAYVDRVAPDDDLGAASFLEQVHRRHFYFGAADGAKRDFLHHRVCELAFNATGGGKASTLYDAIGAAQVAKASYAGMRLLHALDGRVPVWPMDTLPAQGSVVVEIYTRAFIRFAGLSGRKVRTLDQLNAALQALGSEAVRPKRVPNDHETDVLIAAAGLRAIADRPGYWHPPALTPLLARTEGWTFGVA